MFILNSLGYQNNVRLFTWLLIERNIVIPDYGRRPAMANGPKLKMGDILRCEEKQSLYDSADINSIFKYAKLSEGKTFLQILQEAHLSAEQIDWIRTKEKDKGLPGKIIEASYFGYELNSRQEADFDQVGVELKSTPADKKKDGNYKSGETLSITQIDFAHEIQTDFSKSHLLNKLRWLLVVFYHRNRQLRSKLDYSILYTSLFKPSEEDLIIIERDYRSINDKLKAGLAHTLSRRDGVYLGTAPKSTNASNIVTPFYGGKPIVKRSYTLKKSYVQVMLDGYRLNEEHLIKNIEELRKKSLPEIIKDRLYPYRGMDIEDIADMIGCNLSKKTNANGREILTEATFPDLTARMLGLKQLRNEEFIKAGIVVKVIVFSEHGINNQHFRLGDAHFMEIANTPDYYEGTEQDAEGNDVSVIRSGWEESELFYLLDELKYLFVIYQETKTGTVYRGSRLWGMSDDDIELAHQDWLDIKKVLSEGVSLNRVPWGSGERTENNLPGVEESRIIHLRPHGDKSFYVDSDGSFWGNGKKSDTDLLPDGRRMVRQSYWLKQKYVRKLVQDLLVL